MRMKTEPSENITNYATRLRKAANKCDFRNWSAESMIKSLIISNMHDGTLRLKFLQKDRTLDQILDIARKKEDAVARSKVMDGESRSVVGQVNAKRGYPLPKKMTSPPEQCNGCGHDKHFPASECPAASRICNYCKKKGHYANKCFKKKKEVGANLIDEEHQTKGRSDTDSDTDEYDVAKIELVNSLETRKKPSLMRVHTNGQEVLWQPDTGTQRDVWDERQFHSFKKKARETVQLSPTNIRLFAYGGKASLSVIGSFKTSLNSFLTTSHAVGSVPQLLLRNQSPTTFTSVLICEWQIKSYNAHTPRSLQWLTS